MQDGSFDAEDSSKIEDVGQETRGCTAGFADVGKDPKPMVTGLQELRPATASPQGTGLAQTSLPAEFPHAFCDGNVRL